MNKRIASTLLLLCIGIVAAIGLHCGGSEVVGRGGSEVVGKLVDSTDAPVGGAKVYALKPNPSNSQKVDTAGLVETDSKGGFKFDKLDIGIYSLYGTYKNNELVALIPDVRNEVLAEKGQPPILVDKGKHTMRRPGSISGKVILYGDDHSGVSCFIPQTSFICITGTAGDFKITGIPQGTYCVLYTHANYKTAKDTPVVVFSGKDTLLPPKKLQLSTILGVQPLIVSATPHTPSGTVTLCWKPVPFDDLEKYFVLHHEKGAPRWDTAVVKAPDTVYIDTVFKDLTDTRPRDMEYKVRCVDKPGNSSGISKIVEVHIEPPSTATMTIIHVPQRTIIPFNGAVRCSVVVGHMPVNYSIFMDFDGPGTAYEWTRVSHSNGIADTSFSTAGASAWNRVAVRAASSLDTADTAFSVDIRPRSDSGITATATDSGVVLKWRRSPETDFKQYEVHRKKTVETIVDTLNLLTDTACIFKTLENGAADYWITVTDTESVTSLPGVTKTIAIINTPPDFTTKPADLPDSAEVEKKYQVTLAAADKNKDTLAYKVLSPAGATCVNGVFSWTPRLTKDTNDVGVHSCLVEVSDGLGGKDTLAWNVRVVAHDRWLDMGLQLKLGRCSFGIGVLNGKVYVAGGYDIYNGLRKAMSEVEVYDTSTKSWSPAAPLLKARYNHCMVVWEGKLFVFGGLGQGILEQHKYPKEIELYDAVSNAWKSVGSMPFIRFGSQACVIGDSLYCIGGEKKGPSAEQPTIYLDSINIYNLRLNEWTKGFSPKLNGPRSQHQAVVVNGKIFIFGGMSSQVDALKSIEVFDPKTGVVSQKQDSLGNVRCYFGAGVVGNKLFLTGGNTLQKNVVYPEIVDVTGGMMQITAVSAMPRPRHSAGVVALNGLIYCIGGSLDHLTSQTAISQKDVLIYYP